MSGTITFDDGFITAYTSFGSATALSQVSPQPYNSAGGALDGVNFTSGNGAILNAGDVGFPDKSAPNILGFNDSDTLVDGITLATLPETIKFVGQVLTSFSIWAAGTNSLILTLQALDVNGTAIGGYTSTLSLSGAMQQVTLSGAGNFYGVTISISSSGYYCSLDSIAWTSTSLANPFINYDWLNYNPRINSSANRYMAWESPQTIDLHGQDKIYATPGEVPPYDWQNPRGRPYPIELRTLTLDYSIALTPLLPFSGGGFYSFAGQNPRGSPYPLELRTIIVNLNNNTLRLQDRIYDSPGEVPSYDWPNPRGRPYPIELRTFLLSLNNFTLAKQDKIYATPGEVPAYDWQNPRPPDPRALYRGNRWHSLGVIGGLDTIYSGQGEVASYDWPNPRGYRYPLDLRALNYNFTLIIPPIIPDQNIIHDLPPNPRGYVYPLALRTFTLSLNTFTLNQQDRMYGTYGQVTNYDWPNPILPKFGQYRAANAADSTLYPPILAGSAIIYGAIGQVPNYDWPNPILLQIGRYRQASTAQDQVQAHSFVPILLGQDVMYLGTQQVLPYDWPNPILPQIGRYRQASTAQDQVHQSSYEPLFPGQDRMYLGTQQVLPYDWPNPIRLNLARYFIAFISQDSVQLHAYVPLFEGTGTIYGAVGEVPPYDWPNPILPNYVRYRVATTSEDQVQRHSFVPILLGQDKMYLGTNQVLPYDWPNPILPKFGQYRQAINSEDQVQRHAYGPLYVNHDKMYGDDGNVADYDWPNPIISLKLRENRNWNMTSPQTTLLFKQDRIYGAIGQVPPYDWQNPWGYRYPVDLRSTSGAQALHLPAPILHGDITVYAQTYITNVLANEQTTIVAATPTIQEALANSQTTQVSAYPYVIKVLSDPPLS